MGCPVGFGRQFVGLFVQSQGSSSLTPRPEGAISLRAVALLVLKGLCLGEDVLP